MCLTLHLLLTPSHHAVTHGDACLEAAGSVPKELHFLLYVEWPQPITLLTFKSIRVERRCRLSQKLVSINRLEFLVEIVSYVAIPFRFFKIKFSTPSPTQFY